MDVARVRPLQIAQHHAHALQLADRQLEGCREAPWRSPEIRDAALLRAASRRTVAFIGWRRHGWELADDGRHDSRGQPAAAVVVLAVLLEHLTQVNQEQPVQEQDLQLE